MGLLLQLFCQGTAIVLAFISSVLCGIRLLLLIVCDPKGLFYSKTRNEVPACLTDPALGKHAFIRLQNGIKLHYVVSGNAHDPLMLMVHGFPECWYTWRHQILEFQKDYRVVAVDLRGYGDSDKPPNRTDYRAENITEDLKLLISGLGYNNCTLVAHDWGGVIAFMLAEQCPSSVNRLIVMNTTRRTIMFRLLFNHDPRPLLRLWYTFFFQCPYLPEAFLGWRDSRILKDMFRTASGQAILSDDELEAYKYYFSRPGGWTYPLNYYRCTCFPWRDDFEVVYIPVPTLMIWGDKDPALRTELALLNGENCEDYTARLVNGCSHWVQQQEPEVVNRYMREWLTGKKITIRKDKKK